MQMSITKYNKSRRATFNLTVHIIFVTKYRRKVLTKQMLESLKSYFASILTQWGCKIIEYNGEADHIHLLVSIKPDKRISDLIGNLKSSSCKNLWRDYPELSQTYWAKKVLWTPSYFVASCGGVTIEQLEKYIQSQDSPA
jgi:putative transposase